MFTYYGYQETGCPLGFGRKPLPAEAAGNFGDERQQQGERHLPPPLVAPIAVDEVVMFWIVQRYNLPLPLPPAKFE